MTGTTVRHLVISGDANLVGNTPLEDLMHRELQRLGPPVFDEADRETGVQIPDDFQPRRHSRLVRSVRPEAAQGRRSL